MHSSCEIEDFRRNSYLGAVCHSPIARITLCVLTKYISRRLTLELQRSLYQGQQGDVNQSVSAETVKPVCFRGGKNLTAVRGRKCITSSSISCKSHNR